MRPLALRQASLLSLTAFLACINVRAEIKMPPWSAGVRENYVSSSAYDFGSDRMARVKASLVNQGFASITAHLRLSMQSATDSIVVLPPMRTSKPNFESFLARQSHAGLETVLKPLIGQDPKLGVLARLTDINPENPPLWFQSYGVALKPYISLAKNREIHEIVVGTGLHHLWIPENRDYWYALVKDLRKTVGLKTRLSFELSSDKDIQAFEQWKKKDPDGLKSIVELMDRVRMSVHPIELRHGVGDWNAEETATRITYTIERAQNLFPSLSITLAHVTIPACRDYERVEDELICLPLDAEELKLDPESDAFKTRKFDKDYQEKGLQTWFAALESLHPIVRKLIKEVEFFEAPTEYDPEQGSEDARFPFFNKQVETLLNSKKKSSAVSAASRGPASQPASSDDYSRLRTSSFPRKSDQGPPKKLACVYYDTPTAEQEKQKKDYVGPIQARMLQSLIGAFKEWRAAVEPVRRYVQGDMDRCEAVFYISSRYDLELSSGFLTDLSVFMHRHPVVWMNYKLTNFVNFFNEAADRRGGEKIEFDVPKVIQPDATPSPKNIDPGFFRYFDYKGVTFEKLARWDPVGNWFASSPEINQIAIQDEKKVRVHATARHSKQPSGASIPYAVSQDIQQGSLWYVADLPLAYVHYEDRYFILCDLLWDILKATPPPGPRNALVRIEDVNASYNMEWLRWAIDYLADNKVPFSLAIIPYFSNVFAAPIEDNRPAWQSGEKYPEFVGMLRYAKARGANFVWHGVAHQAGDLISGFDGVTGADYEFWHYPQNKPHPKDSSDFVMNLLEKGEATLDRLGIRPIAWEVPHYAASVLDYIIFGRLFEWNYHRSIYFSQNLPAETSLEERHRMFDCVSAECRSERRILARDIKVDADYAAFGGLIAPYPIWEDSYGQSVIPETLGMIDYPFYHDKTIYPVSRPADLVRRAKLLSVVRGAYASFFWHPDLLAQNSLYYRNHPGNYDTEGGKNTLTKTVEGIQAAGYQFRSIADCSLFPRAACASGGK